MKKILIFSCVLFICINKGKAQSNSTGLTVKMDGYIINLGGEIIFQPCEDSSVSVWDAMNNTSFSIRCNSFNDQYCEAINNIGDSVNVRCYIFPDSSYYDTRMSFFYCTIVIYMDLLSNDKNDFDTFITPQYEIHYNQKKYPLKGFYVREWVHKLIPHDRKNLLLMYRYYADKGYRVPDWLEALVKCKDKK